MKTTKRKRLKILDNYWVWLMPDGTMEAIEAAPKATAKKTEGNAIWTKQARAEWALGTSLRQKKQR